MADSMFIVMFIKHNTLTVGESKSALYKNFVAPKMMEMNFNHLLFFINAKHMLSCIPTLWRYPPDFLLIVNARKHVHINYPKARINEH